MERGCGERRRIKTSFISMIDSLRLTDRSFRLEERLPTLAWKESTYKKVKQQQLQNVSIIKNDYIFRLFAAISLSSFFFSWTFFIFELTKKKKNKNYLKLVQLFFGHNFLFTEGDTLKVTLSKLSKLSVSNYFLIHVEVQFYSFLFLCMFPFVLWYGNVDNEFRTKGNKI